MIVTNQPLWKQLEKGNWTKVIELLQDNLITLFNSEANKAKMPEITLCRDCIHWECNIANSELENYPRNIKPSDGWIDGQCSKLKYETYISTYGGNQCPVVLIETDANFWCACGSPK